MAQTCSYSVVAAMGCMPNPYSTAHTKGGFQEWLLSCVCGSSASSSVMALDLSTDIKGTILDFQIGEFTSKVGDTFNQIKYSSASGSASTGGILAWSTAVSAGDTASNVCLSKNGQDLSSLKFRARVLATDVV